MNALSSGIKTSELKVAILAIASIVGTFLVSAGVLSKDQIDPLVQMIGDVFTGTTAFLAILGVFHSFNKGRVEIKKAAINQGLTVSTGETEQQPVTQPVFPPVTQPQPGDVAPSASY